MCGLWKADRMHQFEEMVLPITAGPLALSAWVNKYGCV